MVTVNFEGTTLLSEACKELGKLELVLEKLSNMDLNTQDDESSERPQELVKDWINH